MPSVYICSPSRSDFVSRGFTTSLRNMFIPFPDHHYEPVQGRNIPDARNAGIFTALENGFDYIMQVDEDQRFPWDFFIELYGGIKEYGKDAIVTGWSICKSGLFGGQPSVFRKGDDGVYALTEAELQASEKYIEVDAFGSCGWLAHRSLFEGLQPPWFADIHLIHPSEIGPDGLYEGSIFSVGQDIYLANRVKQNGGRVVCATNSRMPHEYIATL